MKGSQVAAVVGALWLGCLTGPIAAQQPDPAPDLSAGVVEELAGLGVRWIG